MLFFSTAIKSFNMEITNKCTLGCLECPRTGNPWVLKNLTDLPLDLIKEIFPMNQKEKFSGLGVNLKSSTNLGSTWTRAVQYSSHCP